MIFAPTAALLVALTTCTPTPAWSESVTITPAQPAVPAQGEPTLTIDNPNYVPPIPGSPEVPERSHVVHHPAQGEPTITIANPDYRPAVEHGGTPDRTIHHDAVTHVEWKYVRHGGYGERWLPNDDFKYVDADGNGSNSKPRYGAYYERTQKTRTVVDCPARDELIPGTPGWTEPAVGQPTITIPNPDYVPARDEVVIDQPYQPEIGATPAQGEPTLTVPNLEYVAPKPGVDAVVRVVEHAAVTCPADPTPAPEPIKPEQSKPMPAPETAPKSEPRAARSASASASAMLAQTGAEIALFPLAGGLIALTGLGLMAGAGATKLRRYYKED